MNAEIPEPWASRMKQRGHVRGDGQPNISSLARAARVSVETARRALHGKGEAAPSTVIGLVDALGEDVQEWLGRRVDGGPWMPPEEATFLSPAQREALENLIRVMTTREEERPAQLPTMADVREDRRRRAAQVETKAARRDR